VTKPTNIGLIVWDLEDGHRTDTVPDCTTNSCIGKWAKRKKERKEVRDKEGNGRK